MSAAGPSPAAPAPARKSFAQVAAAAHKQPLPLSKPPATSENPPTNQVTPAPPEEIKVTQDGNPEAQVAQTTPSVAKLQEPAVEDTSRLNVMMKSVALEDNSSNGFDFVSRKETSDTKSVASRTTFTLDEKESLRPDDSASMQAGGDDDSPNESVIAGTKANSNSDARAFRDQLYEIDRTGMAQRQAGTMGLAAQRNGGMVFTPPGAQVQSPPDQVQPPPSTGPPPGLVIPPDEKLQEALASPKDRLFVLKVEQDLIDFIKDSKDHELQLPQTNAFYRMLCHKLAEYYFLGHVVDDSLSAVRIFRLPHSRLPPPLIDSETKPDGATPPPTNSARKIMRRGAGEPVVTRDSDIEGSSSRPDTGNNSGSEDDKDKVIDKSQLTREEREKQYNEARARIFDGFESKNESENGQDSKGISRTSSASGHKKNKKKRPKDDSFEARSAYSQFHGQSYVNNGFFNSPPNAYYPMMTGYSGVQPQFNAAHQQGYPVDQHNYGMNQQWAGQQYQGQYDMNTMPQYNSQQFDGSSSGYQQYAASNVPNMQSQSTPKPQQPSLAGYYNQGYQQSPGGMQWMQQQQQQQQHSPYQNYATPQGYEGGQYMMPYGAQGGYPQQDFQQYPYGPYGAGGFNPQSQAFIPRTGPSPWAHMASPMQGQHSVYGSPRYSSASPNVSTSRSQQSHSQQNSKRSSQTGSNMDSIKQWQTPANLPAKPPPPASGPNFSASKFKENSQPLAKPAYGNNNSNNAPKH